jgi:nucleoside-diphosphate-sugar epimerase
MQMNIKGKKILITGGAGFIGSNIAEKLLKMGAKVRVMDNLLTGRRSNIAEFLDNPNFEFLKKTLQIFPIVGQLVMELI